MRGETSGEQGGGKGDRGGAEDEGDGARGGKMERTGMDGGRGERRERNADKLGEIVEEAVRCKIKSCDPGH